jgi:DNA-binding CsgD family transcriptional regulator
MKDQGVFDDLDFTNVDTMDRHPYYQEFLAPHGLRWFAGVGISSGGNTWCVSIQRLARKAPFSPQEKLLLKRLSRSLTSGVAIAQVLEAATLTGALDAFEMRKTAVALVKRNGEVFKLNKSAEDFLRDGIRLESGQLISTNATATAELGRAIRDLIWQTTGIALSPPVALPRINRRPLLVYPAKLAGLTSNALADCQAALILVDPEMDDTVSSASLRSAFGFTAAESRLANRLALGESLNDICDEFQISKETGRTQVKTIFKKTGVHRQAELVALFSNLLKV